MANAVGKGLTIGALVLAVPAACLGGLAMYGKALEESEPSVGTVISADEARARQQEAHDRFVAMTPAQHLAEARLLLDADYDPETRTGGNFRGFARHADAIPPGTPEHAAVQPLRDIPRQRWDNLLVMARGRIDHYVRDHRYPASGAEQRAARVALAHDVDEMSARQVGARSVGGVHSADEGDTALRLDHPDCWPGMLSVVAPAETQGALRSYGFRAVRCRNGNGLINL